MELYLKRKDMPRRPQKSFSITNDAESATFFSSLVDSIHYHFLTSRNAKELRNYKNTKP